MFFHIFLYMVAALVLYYVVLIAMDLHRANLEEKAKESATDEVEIDISEEASDFKPTEITRSPKPESQIQLEEPFHYEGNDKEDESYPESEITYTDQGEEKSLLNEDTETLLETLGRIPDDLFEDANGYSTSFRQPVMTDGIEVNELLSMVDQLAQKGESELGDLIYKCQEAA